MKISRLSLIKYASRGIPLAIIAVALIGFFLSISPPIPDIELEKMINQKCIGFWKESGEIHVKTCNDGDQTLSTQSTIKECKKQLQKFDPKLTYFFCWGGGCINVTRIEKICNKRFGAYVVIDSRCESQSEDMDIPIPKFQVKRLKQKIDEMSYSIFEIKCE